MSLVVSFFQFHTKSTDTVISKLRKDKNKERQYTQNAEGRDIIGNKCPKKKDGFIKV